MNVNRRTVYVWEAGRTEPTRGNLESIAALLGRPVDWFLEGAGDEVTARLDDLRFRIGRLPHEYLEVVDTFVGSLEKALGSRR